MYKIQGIYWRGVVHVFYFVFCSFFWGGGGLLDTRVLSESNPLKISIHNITTETLFWFGTSVSNNHGNLCKTIFGSLKQIINKCDLLLITVNGKQIFGSISNFFVMVTMRVKS